MTDREHPDVIKLLYYDAAEKLSDRIDVLINYYHARKAKIEAVIQPLLMRPRGRGFFHLVRVDHSKPFPPDWWTGSGIGQWFGGDLPDPPILLPGGKPSEPEYRRISPPEGYIEITETISGQSLSALLLCTACTEDCKQLVRSFVAEIVNSGEGKILQGTAEGLTTSIGATRAERKNKRQRGQIPTRAAEQRKWAKLWEFIEPRVMANRDLRARELRVYLELYNDHDKPEWIPVDDDTLQAIMDHGRDGDLKDLLRPDEA